MLLLRGPKEWTLLGFMMSIELERFSWDIREHSFYRPGLTLSKFHIFGPHKENLAGKRFATDAESKQAVTLLLTFDTDLFCDGMHTLVPH